MSSPVRLLILTAAIATTLAGCNRDKQEASVPATPVTVPARITPADAAAPFTFESKTPFAEVSLKLSEAVKGQPDLHARLYSSAVRDLREFTEGAQADRTEAGGDEGAPGYEKTITFDTPVETARLFSLARSDYEFTGGAHGVTLYAGVLWDKTLKRPVPLAELLRKDADPAALDRALCTAVNAAKRERDPTLPPVPLSAKDGWACVKAADTPFVLALGSTPGKAGGLTFLIGPYLVGSYAEGAYLVDVPVSAFSAMLATAYAGEFAGAPVGRKPA